MLLDRFNGKMHRSSCDSVFTTKPHLIETGPEDHRSFIIDFFSLHGLNILNEEINHERLNRCRCLLYNVMVFRINFLVSWVTWCIFIFTIRSFGKLQISSHGSLECTASQHRKL